MKPKYEDFYLIVDGEPGHYTVEAEGPGNIRTGRARFEYQETEELRVELNQIRAGFAPSRPRMQAVGETLFKALFPYEILPAFVGAKSGLPQDTHLRLKLIIRPPELGLLPWELTYDILDRTFIAARRSRPIVRYVEQGTPPEPLLARRPLRVLYVQANPKGTGKLDAAASEQALREALGELGEVVSVRDATPEALRDALRENTCHVLYYDGHGGFDDESDTGYLFLHGEGDRAYPLDGEVLATYLDGSSIRLLMLSACETAADSVEKRFSGLAGRVIGTTRLPAGVALTVAIPQRYARASTPAGALSDRVGRRGVIIGGYAVFALVYLGVAGASTIWHVWLLFAAYGLYYGLTEGVQRAYAADLVPAHLRGTAFGVYHTLTGLALFPASVVAGWLWQTIGVPAPFIYGAVMSGLAVVIFVFTVRG